MKSSPLGGTVRRDDMKIIKIADYDNEKERLTYDEALKAVEKQGCRLLTTNEYLSMDKKTFKEYYSAVPTWLAKTSSGLLARGNYVLVGYFRRVVVAGDGPSFRFGVLGTPISSNESEEIQKVLRKKRPYMVKYSGGEIGKAYSPEDVLILLTLAFQRGREFERGKR